jgi:hypothetical protein
MDNGVLSSRLLWGHRAAEVERSRGRGRQRGETSMTPVMGYENGEEDAMGCGHFQRGRGGVGETTPRCRRRMTQRRAAR